MVNLISGGAVSKMLSCELLSVPLASRGIGADDGQAFVDRSTGIFS
jgi:hypothetical protein